MTATILRIPNENHMARVREARRAAGLWLPSGFPPAASAVHPPRRPRPDAFEASVRLTDRDVL